MGAERLELFFGVEWAGWSLGREWGMGGGGIVMKGGGDDGIGKGDVGERGWRRCWGGGRGGVIVLLGGKVDLAIQK